MKTIIYIMGLLLTLGLVTATNVDCGSGNGICDEQEMQHVVDHLDNTDENLQDQIDDIETGIVGPTGPKGNTGATGPQGEQGPQGIAGNDGKDGLNGQDGQNGLNGENGIDGQDGEDGYTPIKGIDYFDGKDGKDGLNGKDGSGHGGGISLNSILKILNGEFLTNLKELFSTNDRTDLLEAKMNIMQQRLNDWTDVPPITEKEIQEEYNRVKALRTGKYTCFEDGMCVIIINK